MMRVAHRSGLGSPTRFVSFRAFWVKRLPWLRKVRRRLDGFLTVDVGGVPHGATPFVILASHRSGSTLLVERLTSQWTTIRSDGEVFNPKNRGARTFDQIFRGTYYTDSGHELIGCKVLAAQVSDDELATLLTVPAIRVVVLERRNLIRQFVSREIAYKDDVWVQTTRSERTEVSERSVRVDVATLLAYRDKRKSWYERYERVVKDLPNIKVVYEDMMEDLEGEVGKVATFLGVGEPSRRVPPRIRRQNPEPLRELVVNFDELRESLIERGEDELVAHLDS